MIYRSGKEIVEIIHGTSPIVEVYRNKFLVWQLQADAARSCYGSGYWVNDRPWLNEDAWKN